MISTAPAHCADRPRLRAYADGALPPDQAARLAQHVAACGRCRSLVAKLPVPALVALRADAEPDVPDAAVDDNPPPAAILRDYLRRDARERERTISRFWFVLTLVTMPSMIPPAFWGLGSFTLFALPIHGLFLIYQAAVIWSLRRSPVPSWLPLASTLVEAGFFAAMQITAICTIPYGIASGNPALPLRGAIIVLTAIRVQPQLCIVAGIAGAIESLGVFLAVSRIPGVMPMALGAIAMRAVFMLAAGVGGALLARYLVTRAERVLSEVRALDLFGKYMLEERIGIGGMGEVFRATYCPEGGFVRPVAVKRLRDGLSGDERFREAFKREARLCASLTHPNLVQVLDCGRYRGSFVVAMELVEGVSLRQLARRAPLHPAAVAFIGAELAAALDYVHGRRGPDGRPLGLVHCDLNPPNVLLSRLGEVKLGDFGVARAAQPILQPARDGFAGKMPYAAPEQLRGEAIDSRADLYALGLTLFEALTGQPMFQPGESALAAAVRPPSSVRADTPPELERVILSLLELDPARRPASANAVREALCRLSGDAAPYPQGETILIEAVELCAAAERRT